MTDTATGLAAASLTFSILSFLVLVVGIVSWSFGDWTKLTQSLGGVGGTSSSLGSIKTLAVLMGALSPDIALLIGFLSDIMNFKFRFSVTSIVGIIAALLSSGFTYVRRFFSKTDTSSAQAVAEAVAQAVPVAIAAPISAKGAFNIGVGVGGKRMAGGVLPQYIQDNYNPCSIRGMGFADVPGSHMGIAALAAIFAIYIMDMSLGAKRTTPEIGGYIAFAVIIFGLNVYGSSELKCVNEANGGWMAYAIALAVGLGVGASAYMVMKTHYADFLPLDPDHVDGRGASNKPRCNKPNDNDQFVCAAYKDGKPITSPAVVS